MATITGTNGDDILIGTASGDLITGLDGNDIIDGGNGADTMIGGDGNDIYGVEDFSDVITELANEGIDQVNTNVSSYTLGANVENLLYTGSSGITATGNELDNYMTGGMSSNDTLTGGAGNDTLDGLAGADTMTGGTGDDIYGVDNASDVVNELANEGIDQVNTNLSSYTLSTNVENLLYTGSSGITATGNALANEMTGGMSSDDTLIGGGGNDTLDGLAGADTMTGGTGDDVYGVDNASDVVIEQADEGTDTIRTNLASYTLAANLENVTYTGGGNFAGTGNGAANVMIGGTGNDALDGQDGNDILTGGIGNDSLIGGSGTDTAIYAGVRADYDVTFDVELGKFIVTDLNAGDGDDGVDNVMQVENLQFSDQTLDLGVQPGAVASAVLVPVNGAATGRLTGSGLGVTFEVEDGEAPIHGTLLVDPNGSFTYTPDADYGGYDSFKFRVTDITGNWSVAEVNIGVGEQAHPIEQSSQFENSNGSRLTQTFSTGDQQKWTWSGWVKLDELGSYRSLFTDRATSFTTGLIFTPDNRLEAHIADGSSTTYYIRTDATFTDTSSWVHIVWAVDTTQATVADRNVLYIDGERVTSLERTDFPPQNYVSRLNSAVEHSIGVNSTTVVNYFDGFMADVNFVDGQQLDAGAFGTGGAESWIATEYAGTYGTNGFHLTFDDPDALGADSSGNGNDWAAVALTPSDEGPNTGAVVIDPTPGNDVFVGTVIQNEFVGLDGNDVLNGAGGDDLLTGDAGNDTLIGGSGFDVAFYSGARSGYEIRYDVELGKLIVEDVVTGNGNDGTDALTGVEELRFSDETVAISAPPEAHKSAVLVPINGSAAGTLTGVGGDLVYSIENAAEHGTATVNANGTFSYTPNSGYSGGDTFAYRVTDANGIASIAEVTIGVAGPNLDQSAYFDNAAAARLTQTFSAGNSQEWTWSGWVKLGDLGSLRTLFSDRAESFTTGLVLNSSNQLEAHIGNGSSASYVVTSNATFTNTSDWIHIVWAVDTTQATAANRSHLYVDGVELTSFASANYPPQNFASGLNTAKEHSIGVNSTSHPQYFDGYLADVNFVDGQQLGASAFGVNGSEWMPKDFEGAFGTNGFHLTFNDTGTLGSDISGNDNDWSSTAVQAANEGPTSGTTPVEVMPTDGNDVFIGGSNDDSFATGAGNDVLNGKAGDDQLAGEAGNDILIGGGGNDLYVFDRAGNIDTVTNAAPDNATTQDRVEFGSNIAYDQLWLVQSGDDLVVSIIGTNDSVRLEDWYSDSSTHVDALRTTADGHELTDARVAALVSAMSGYAPPAGTDSDMPAQMRAELDGALAAAWQLL